MISQRGCILKSLANPMLNGILLGLEWRDYELLANDKLLPCCEGRGFTEDPQHATQIRCSLVKRVRATEAILYQYMKTWSHCRDLAPHSIHASHSARLLRQVAESLKGYRPQGSVVNGRQGKPSDFWAMALASTWRFGIHSHVVTLSKATPKTLLPSPDKENDTLAIFVEQVDKLWDDKQAAALEAIVNYAYNSNALLWIEFCKEQSHKVEADSFSLEANFKRRISNVKSRSPYEFLDQDCVSRLKSLCSFPKSFAEEGFVYD
ncbi:hypothetical protein [Pseudobacteriovorax antillogorgiicola]|uniref:Uncharacterized protein n=1 Tax=Pseudobacteriovorax antillogorgiicola TaxID=1513793 RepID=A0A1Y6C451_9BACT|nr:hypothetical protein [Pseudobacteriovorax antillogorgiicola]TCS50726.1 hypothetical protein EDD56_112109 [Pseudobacteriovorax antillogorgiicola]SMF40858.1 hypothetical protein SAMN06296036_112108 [Pseudobacteriovorax antillogorgiicola]